jgi:hypothetical protein
MKSSLGRLIEIAPVQGQIVHNVSRLQPPVLTSRLRLPTFEPIPLFQRLRNSLKREGNERPSTENGTRQEKQMEFHC